MVVTTGVGAGGTQASYRWASLLTCPHCCIHSQFQPPSIREPNACQIDEQWAPGMVEGGEKLPESQLPKA